MNDILEAFDREPAQPKPLPSDPAGFDRSRWGLFPDVDLLAYHAGFIEEITLSQSGMGRILDETPLDFAFNHPQLNPDAEKVKATVAKLRGDLVHQLTLGKGRGFVVSPHDEFRTKEAKAWRDDVEASGKIPVKQKQLDEAEIMAEVLRERINEILDGAPYETEVAFLYQEQTAAGPIWVRGCLDVWCEEKRTIIDPKVTPNLYGKVGNHMINMGWDRQAALYAHAVREIMGYDRPVRFLDLFVKPEPPFTSRIGKLDKGDEYQAIKQCRIAMERFGACLYAGKWPGFSDQPEIISLPDWERKRRDAMEMAEGL